MIEEMRDMDHTAFDRRTAYGRGYRAATDGSSNPYPTGSQLAKCWDAGLEHAREELS